MRNGSVQEQEFSAAELEAALGRLAILIEAYPVYLTVFERIEYGLSLAKARELSDTVRPVRQMLAAKKGVPAGS